MPQHRPIELKLSHSDASHLFQWLSDSGEIAFLTDADGSAETNRALNQKAVELLKSGLDNSAKLKQYNETLMAQRWCAFRSVAPDAQDYLLWHIPSGSVEVENIGIRGPRYLEVADPFAGWQGPSGSAEHLPARSIQPCFLDMHVEFASETGNSLGITFIQQSHGQKVSAPRTLKNFWARLKKFAQANLHAARL